MRIVKKFCDCACVFAIETRGWSSWGGRAGPKNEIEMHTEQALLRQWAWESKFGTRENT